MTLPTGGVALSLICSQERGSFYVVSYVKYYMRFFGLSILSIWLL